MSQTSHLRYFRGGNLILINKSSTDYDVQADLAFHRDVIDVVTELEQLGV